MATTQSMTVGLLAYFIVVGIIMALLGYGGLLTTGTSVTGAGITTVSINQSAVITAPENSGFLSTMYSYYTFNLHLGDLSSAWMGLITTVFVWFPVLLLLLCGYLLLRGI